MRRWRCEASVRDIDRAEGWECEASVKQDGDRKMTLARI